MGAEIVKRIIFEETLVVNSPLRIGSGMSDNITDMLVLKDKAGNAFIPGTSLAGVMRSEIEALYGKETADVLFGTIESGGNQSLICINDVVLKDSEIVIRDGIHLDPFAGTVKTTAKYDYEAVERGTEGILRMEIVVRSAFNEGMNLPKLAYNHKEIKEGDFFEELAASIADILTIGIGIGASTTKGFGRVATKKECGWVKFDYRNAKDLQAWIEYLKSGKKPVNSYVTVKKNVQYTYNDFWLEAEFALRSSLLVKNSELRELKDEDKTTEAACPMMSKGDYIIPGTSIKGTLRSHAEKLLVSMGCKNPSTVINPLMGFSAYDSKSETTTGQRGNLFVDDVYINRNKLAEVKQSRIRIDRFTGGIMPGALFNEFPVWQQKMGEKVVRFNFRIQDCTDAQAGLMLMLLREMWLGYMPFGGGKAIGRGVLDGVSANIHFRGEKITLQKDERNVKFIGKMELVKSYLEALEGEIDG